MGTQVNHQNPSASGHLFSLRHYLNAMVLTALVPTIALVAFAVWHAGTTLRAASADLLLSSARTMAGAIERELDSSAAMLETIALYGAGSGQMPSGSEGRLLVVPGRAQRASQPALLEPAGLPDAVLQEALARGSGPVISNLFAWRQGAAYHRRCRLRAGSHAGR